MGTVKQQIHGEIPHWLCVECSAIQPERTGEYPAKGCWRCENKDQFIRDVLPAKYIYVAVKD